MRDPTSDPQNVLTSLEKAWKDALDKREQAGVPSPARSSNPRLDPTQDFALGMTPQGQPNLVPSLVDDPPLPEKPPVDRPAATGSASCGHKRPIIR